MPFQDSPPYLSIVVASRNDDHGGDMRKRMRIFVKDLLRQCNKFKLTCELLMVEWNPIPGEALLHEILPAPAKEDYLRIRYILVPNELHNKLNFSEQIPLFQMIAKNVGIRRASAEFVLCTNVDIIFSDELFARLAKKDLQQDHFYRTNRCDVPNTLDENWPMEQQLEFCKTNIKKRNGKNKYYANFENTYGILFKYRWCFPLLKMLARIKASYANGLMDRFATLDFDACGDFTLMSKKNWTDIQGYPELEVYSIHIDSMGVLAAAALEFKQVIFEPEECTYHMEHGNGWEFKDPIQKIHFYTKKPMLDWWTVREAGIHIMKHKQTFNLNNEHWGFHTTTLQEITVPSN